MSGSSFAAVEEAFAAARELTGDARERYLAGCDDAVSREVRALLACADTADAALERVIAHDAARFAADHAAARVGARLGAYRVLEPLGEGGMGVVYLAERADRAYRQRVAIKILQHAGTADAMARFRDERQILAALDHPGIVRLLDGGTTDDGVPYLVMEHVAGVPLTRFADGRTIRAKVELVLRVCEALQYAHGKLVVHRDLKPSNILVTADGQPKLLDFGIAKLLAPTDALPREARTRTGGAALTPEYASPEQVRGERVSVATDVYSLGAVLYELLAGRSPHGAVASPVELLRAICDVEPPPPSTARRDVPADLDNIVLRALAKEPARRYPSIEQLADDLRRFLDGLPVRARKPTFRYRAGKLVRRHRGKLALAALAVTALTVTTVISIEQARKADASARRARHRFDDVRALANSLIFEFDESIRELTGATAARELVVSRAVEYLDRLAADAGDDPALARELARAYMRIGDIQGNEYIPNLGRFADAMESYRKAAGLIGDRDDPASRAARVQQALGEGMVHLGARDYSGMQARLERGLAMLPAVPAGQVDRLAVARAHLAMCYRAHERGDLVDAARRLDHLEAELADWDPSAADTRYWRAILLIERSETAGRAGDVDRAIADAREAAALYTRLTEEHPGHLAYERERIRTGLVLAVRLWGRGDGRLWAPSADDADGAVAALAEVLPALERLVAQDPQNTRERIGLGILRIAEGLALAPRSPAVALERFERAQVAFEQLPASRRDTANGRESEFLAHCAAADALAALGRGAEARAALVRGLALAEGNNRPVCQFLGGRALRRLGDREAASAMLDEVALALRARLDEADLAARIGLAETLGELALVRPAARCELARDALAMWRTRPSTTHYLRDREAALATAATEACADRTR